MTARCEFGVLLAEQPPIWRVAANILNKLPRTADKRRLSSLAMGEVLTIPHHKNLRRYETFHKTSELDLYFGTTQTVEK